MEAILAKLKRLDAGYFQVDDPDNDYHSIDKQLPSRLATWLYDRDANFDKETWRRFQKIERLFGRETMDQVFHHLCHHLHDT